VGPSPSTPRGGALQTRDGLVVADLAGFEIAQHRVQCIELHLLQVEVARDGLVVADLAGFEIAQHRVQCIELHLLQVEVAQERSRKSAQLLSRCDQPL
jgi:hypothetical protein